MELEDDDDLGTMIVSDCPLEIENPSPVEFFAEIAEPDPIQVVILASHDLDLDDIPEDIDKEELVEGENVNPHSVGNTSPGIIIRNNIGSFMTDVDLDAALAREFPKYANIVPAHLVDNEFNEEELFVGQQFDNKKDYLHAIKQLSLKLGECWKVSNGFKWRVRAALMQRKQMWMIRKLEGQHTCTSARMSQDHENLDAKTIRPPFKCRSLLRICKLDSSTKCRTERHGGKSKWRCESCMVTSMRHTTSFKGG
ncbi:hypothetical protein GOBAR_DD03560 [Gossypium barbadense]|nr:hypothetical protein GOBAR_DD03560 [Gossypium barbadense]